MPGEIAEMMLEGVLCQGCGEYLGEGDGFPTFCAGCRRPDKHAHRTKGQTPPDPNSKRQQRLARRRARAGGKP